MVALSQCTYRCVVLPDVCDVFATRANWPSQCTYRCVVLPDFYVEVFSCRSV